MRKGSGTFFVYRRFCGESTQNGKQAKAGDHHGGGTLPLHLNWVEKTTFVKKISLFHLP